MSILTKQLKEMYEVVCEPLTETWNTKIIQNKNVSSKLKLADSSLIHKKLEIILTKHYRPVSLLPLVSKVFERVIQKLTNTFIEKHLYPFLYPQRYGGNCQYALVVMIEKWKLSLDNRGFAGGESSIGY